MNIPDFLHKSSENLRSILILFLSFLLKKVDLGVMEEYIVKSPFPDYTPPKCDLWTFLKDSFVTYKDSIALLDPINNISLTFGETQKKAECIASHLQHLGYDHNRPLVIYMSNCCEFVLVCLAVWRLGGSVAVINHLLTAREVHKALTVLNPEYFICNEATVSASIKSSLGTSIKGIICTSPHPGCLPFSSLFAPPPSSQLDVAPLCSVDHKQASIYCFSSGTTGTPKCVEISHGALTEVITSALMVNKMDSNRGSALYQPFSHIYGAMLIIAALKTGQKVIPMAQFDLLKYIQYISEYKLEYLFIVPPIAVLLSKSPLVKQYDMSSVRVLSSGAAPLGKGTELELKAALKNKVSVVQGFGMTETAGGGFLVPAGESNTPQGSIGVPYPNTSAKVIDPETGKSLPAYSRGELCMKGNFFMTGYVGNPKATADMITPDGWLHTGDVTYYDKDSYFFVVDRLKELIKYKGYQVAPSELEALLLTHPSVADVGVTSVPSKEAGELPQAWVVLKPNASITEMELQKFVEDNAAPYKQLRGGVKFVGAIPKSPSGKIMRRIMKDTANKSPL